MAQLTALVNSAISLKLARLQTGPRPLRTTNRLRVRLTTLTRHDNRLRTRRTWSRVTQQHTVVTALGNQSLSTGLPTRMRYQPEVIRRIQLLSAEALIVAWNIHRFVLLATLGTIPVHRQRRLRNVLPSAIVITLLLFMGNPLLRNAIIRPPLDTQQMKERITALTGPN